MSPPRVTVVVLTYDGRALLDLAMPSVLGQDYVGFSAVVVDNGSTDATADHVRARWPGVGLVEIPVNVGVAAALNRGVAAAETEYVVLLNNDVELEPDWLGHLVAALDAHPGAASATGKLMNFHRRDELNAAGDLMRWSGAPDHRGDGEVDGGQFDVAGEVFSPCAGAAIYRRTAFADVGGFDEDFFAYFEDIDWGFRAQLAGWSSWYEPAAVGYHVGGATTGRDPGRYLALLRRNQLLVILKNYPVGALVRHAPAIVLHQAGWFVTAAHQGQLRRHLAVLGSAARAVPLTLRKRRAIQRGRRVSPARLDRVMSPEVYAGATPRERVRSMGAALAPLWQRPWRGTP